MAGDIERWLEGLELEKYADVFIENEVGLRDLRYITEDDLKELGLPLGPRKRIMGAIQSLVEAETPVPERSAVGVDAPTSQAQRRQLTVMFCDLVGSTQLSMSLDPEAYRELMARYQGCVSDAIRAEGGFVAKYLGDGVLAYFGYPEAKEEDAACAMRAALSIRENLSGIVKRDGQPISVRSGMATGTVVVGDLTGPSVTETAAIAGATPNLAQRMQSAAAPSEIIVADDTRRLVGQTFEFEPIDNLNLKGVSGESRAWRLLGEREVVSRFDAMRGGQVSAFVGRKAEIEFLRERWRATRESEGQVVLLIGDPGIGKSRLLSEFTQCIAGEEHDQLTYQCSPMHVQTAFHPVIHQIRRAAGIDTGQSVEKQYDQLIGSLSPSGAIDTETVSTLALLLSFPPTDRYPSLEFGPERLKELTLRALVSELIERSEERPVLLICEDWHWIDPSTALLLEAIIDHIEDARVLMLITSRPEGTPEWLARSHVSQLHLSRLTRNQSNELINQVVGRGVLSGETTRLIADRADGIPLHLEELTKAVDEARVETARSDDHTANLPLTLHASLMARLDRLGPAKAVAQIAAVVGRRFDAGLLADISGDYDATIQGIDQLCQSGLAHRLASIEGAFEFKHALVRDAAYESLLKVERETLHAQIAEFLENESTDQTRQEPELLAQHFEAAGQIEKAVAYWRRAGLQNLGRSQHQVACVCFEKALYLLGQLPEGDATLKQAVDIRFELRGAMIIVEPKRVPTILNNAETIAEKLADNQRKGWAAQYLMISHALLGEYKQAIEAGNRAVTLGKATGDSGLQAVSYSNLAFSYLNQLDFIGAEAPTKSAISMLQGDLLYARERFRMNLTPSVASFARLAWICAEFGKFPEAIEAGNEAFRVAERLQHPASLMEALTGLGIVYLRKGETQKLEDVLLKLEELSDVYSEPTYFHIIAPFLGTAYALCGRKRDALIVLEKALEEGVGAGLAARQTAILSALAKVHLLANRLEDGSDYAARAFARAKERNELGHQACLYFLQGDLGLATDQIERARQNYSTALELANSLRLKPLVADCHFGLARFSYASGDVLSARTELGQATDLYRSMEMPLGLMHAKDLGRELTSHC